MNSVPFDSQFEEIKGQTFNLLKLSLLQLNMQQFYLNFNYLQISTIFQFELKGTFRPTSDDAYPLIGLTKVNFCQHYITLLSLRDLQCIPRKHS